MPRGVVVVRYSRPYWDEQHGDTEYLEWLPCDPVLLEYPETTKENNPFGYTYRGDWDDVVNGNISELAAEKRYGERLNTWV